MADDRLPLLRGKITSVETFEAPRGGGGRPALPSLDPEAHRARLLDQLDAIAQQVKARSQAARDELATREIVAVRPAKDTSLAGDQLDDSSADARLVGVVAETGVVLLDVASAELEHLREKVDAFGDDTKVKVKTDDAGEITSTSRANERAIAPVDSIALASLDDIEGPVLRAKQVLDDRPHWFEVSCRGGYRRALRETENSRGQVARQLHLIGINHKLEEFVGPEQVYFFVRATRHQLDSLRAATDCIYEVELAPEPLRDIRLLEDATSRDLKDFRLIPPPENAPSVVILDTGIASAHPLLKDAILSATTAGPEIPSPEDTYGHGTKMAGLVLYRDLGGAIEHGTAVATHWLQSSRLLVKPRSGTASDENYEKWPVLTLGAVRAAEAADPVERERVITLAITRSMQEEPLDGLVPTLWSHAVDLIAHNGGQGRLVIVSAGDAREEQWLTLSQQYPQLQLSEKIHQPAQAVNALTVGAFTERVKVPPGKSFEEARVVASTPGGLSPFTSTGIPGSEWPTKPDVVLEGGNLALFGELPDANLLSALTTSSRYVLGRPLGQLSMTSESTARAARLAASIWSVEPKLRPESVRGLIVHSASWTPTMIEHFDVVSDRLLACGYGVPDERIAVECAHGRATVLIEDVMPNALIEEEPKKEPPKRAATKPTQPKIRRKVKLYRLPIPSDLMTDEDPDAELRVTLSYFAEPNKFGRTVFHGLDLKWHMQGPRESETEFLKRINVRHRPKGADGRPLKYDVTTQPFNWDIGVQRRSRGTVQSDRWRGKMSALAGDKLIAVEPVLGWWGSRKTYQTERMNFSLIVSVFGPGVYAAIKPRIEASVAIPIQV